MSALRKAGGLCWWSVLVLMLGGSLLRAAPANLAVGRTVRAILDFYKLTATDLLVLCDDYNLPLGKLRIRAQGGAGGHNGLKSVIERLGTEEFVRVRVGVGEQVEGKSLKDHVLERMDSEERRALAEAAARSADALECILVHGTASAMNQFN